MKAAKTEVFVCLCHGLSTRGVVSPQTQGIFLKMTQMYVPKRPAFVVISGGHSDRNKITEATSAIKFMSYSKLIHPSIRNLERVELLVEDYSKMCTGGNISKLKQSKILIENALQKLSAGSNIPSSDASYSVTIFTSKHTKYRTELVAKKIFGKENVSVVGVDISFGGNIQARYNSENLFVVWNWMLNIATFLLLPML